jgi:hypothetical protein
MRFEIFISGARARSSSITASIIIRCVAQHERDKDEKGETLAVHTHNKNNTPALARVCVPRRGKIRGVRACCEEITQGKFSDS